MNTSRQTQHAFHAVRELALAAASVVPADRLAAYDCLAALAARAGLPDESQLCQTVASGLRSEEHLELKFRGLLEGGGE